MSARNASGARQRDRRERDRQYAAHATPDRPVVDATAAPRAVFSRAGGFGVALRGAIRGMTSGPVTPI